MTILRDCHAVSSDTNNVSTKSVTVTTTTSNVILYLIAHQSDLTNDRTINAPTDDHTLTWTLRQERHHQATSGATSWNNYTIYWALAPSAATIVITQTLSGNSDHWVLEVVGFSGLNTSLPFDPDAGLPYRGENHTNVNANPTISGGVTTTNNNDVLVAFYLANENFVPPTSLAARLEPGVSGSPGGYTATDDFTPSSGSLWERFCNAYKVLSAPITAQAHTVSLNSNHTTFVVDALTADSASVSSTISQTLLSITQILNVGDTNGAIAQTLFAISQEIDVTVALNGVIAQTLFPPTQSLTATTFWNTVIAQTLKTVKQRANVAILEDPGNKRFYSWWNSAP